MTTSRSETETKHEKRFVLESNVPLVRIIPGPRSKFPLHKMKPGQSFAFTSEYLRGVQAAVQRFQKAVPDTKFAIRKVEGDRYRCWRLR
jgi:hypothetical protein